MLLSALAWDSNMEALGVRVLEVAPGTRVVWGEKRRWKLATSCVANALRIRRTNGLKMGKLAQTMAMPVWTVAHTSVLWYEGTRLPGG